MVFSNGRPRKVRQLSQKELDKLVEELGGTEKLMESFARHKRDIEFFEYHHKELLKKYPNEWVAVYNVKVADTDKDFFVLLSRLKEKGGANKQSHYSFHGYRSKTINFGTARSGSIATPFLLTKHL